MLPNNRAVHLLLNALGELAEVMSEGFDFEDADDIIIDVSNFRVFLTPKYVFSI